MSKTYHCPSCENEVDRHARICSRPSCRAELAFCSVCHDVVTFKLHAPRSRRFGRDYYRCNGCDQVVLQCRTRLSGGNCNGLARAGKHWDAQFCTKCGGDILDFGKKVALGLVAALIGARIRRPAPKG